MSLAFLKRGKEADAAFAKAEQKAAEQKAAANSDGSSNDFIYKYRYWMPNDTENMITFLDGDLNENGVLEEVCYEEHQIKINNDWKNFFPCTSDTEICPLCTSGAKKQFTAVFTVIDHNEWTDSKGAIHKNEKRLYAVKTDTLKLLRKQAVKRGGLRGCTFEVTRMGDKSPAVGTQFEFEGKENPDQLLTKFDDIAPLNYEEVIQYKTADQLTDLGLGTVAPSIGGESSEEAPDLSKSL